MKKVNEQELSQFELTGNFLYEENGVYYFNDSMNNAIFKQDDKLKGENIFTFKQYVEKFLYVCSTIKNRPSLVFINIWDKNFTNILRDKDFKSYKLVDVKTDNIKEQVKDFDDNACLAYIENSEIFKKFLYELCKREYKLNQRKIVIVFNKPEDYCNLLEFEYDGLKEFRLDVLTSISRGRNISFIFNEVNREKFIKNMGQDMVENIEGSCLTSFICKDEQVKDISPTFHSTTKEIFKEPKEETRESYEQYLNSKTDYKVKLIASDKNTNSKLEKLLGEIPYDMKEWFDKYDGGKINKFEFFSTQANKGVEELKDVNSNSYLKKHNLPDSFYYLGVCENFDDNLDFYLAIRKNWKSLSKYFQTRRFEFVYVDKEQKKSDCENNTFDFYEVIDWISDDE